MISLKREGIIVVIIMNFHSWITVSIFIGTAIDIIFIKKSLCDIRTEVTFNSNETRIILIIFTWDIKENQHQPISQSQQQEEEEQTQHKNIPQTILHSAEITKSELKTVAFDALDRTQDKQHVNKNTKNITHTSDDESEDETDSDFDDNSDNNPGLCSDNEIMQKPSGCTDPTVQEDKEYKDSQQQQPVIPNGVTHK